MAQPDYFSMLDQAPDLKSSLIDIGQQALASGAVKPADARDMMSKMGAKKSDIPKDEDIQKVLTAGLPPSKGFDYTFGGASKPTPVGSSTAQAPAPESSQDPSPLDMSFGSNVQPPIAPLAMSPLQPQIKAGMVPNPGGAAPGKKGSNIQSSLKNTQTEGDKNIQNTYLQGQQLNDITGGLRNLPEMQAQVKSANDLQDQYNKLKNSPANGDDAWVKPFLGLVDAQTGTHMQQNYQPGGISPEERQKLLLQYGDNIDKRRGDIAKSLIEGISKLKSGTDQTTQNNTLAQILAMNQNNSANNLGGLSQARTDALRLRVGQNFDQDKMLTAANNTMNSLHRAESILNGETPVTQKNFALAQQDFINAVANGGAATEGKVNREMVDTLAGKLNDLASYTGNIEDLRKAQPDIFNQLKGMITQVKSDYSRAAQQRADEILLNSRQMSDEGAKKTAEDKYDAITKRYAGYNTPQASNAPLTREQKIAALKAAQAGGQ